MKKRLITIISVCAALVMSLGIFAACGGDNGDKPFDVEEKIPTSEVTGANISVWAADVDRTFVRSMLDKFLAKNPNFGTINIGQQAETEAATTLINDPEAAADVVHIPHDQLGKLTEGDGYIFPVKSTQKEFQQIKDQNTDNTISTITVNGEIMGYPTIAETYFMYYNKTKYSESDVTSFENMFKKAKSSGVEKAVGFDYDNGFYAGMFNLAMEDCFLFKNNDNNQVSLATDKGVAANKWVQTHTVKNELTGDYTDDGEAATALKAGTLGAWITGPWAKESMAEAVGGEANLGMAIIPTFTVDGKEYYPISFSNIKLYVINKRSSNVKAANEIAAFLSSQYVQNERFKQREAIPIDKTLSNSTDVIASDIAKVVSLQSTHALPQPVTPNMGNGWYNNAAAQTMYKAIFQNTNGSFTSNEQIRAALQTIETVCKNGGTSAA